MAAIPKKIIKLSLLFIILPLCTNFSKKNLHMFYAKSCTRKKIEKIQVVLFLNNVDINLIHFSEKCQSRKKILSPANPSVQKSENLLIYKFHFIS